MNTCDTLYVNISRLHMMQPGGPLLGAALGSVSARFIPDAAIAVHGGRVVAAGTRAAIEKSFRPARVRDLGGCLVTPGLVDCHTHPVFAASRIDEFEQKLKGASYESIAASGGGIASSVGKLRAASDEALAKALRLHLGWLRRHGVVAVECKSGYGLSLEHELRSLRLIRDAQGLEGLQLVPTCLAAHSVPPEFKPIGDAGRAAYLEIVLNEILPAVAREKLATAVDVFIERNVFTGDEGRRVLKRAAELGLGAHVHADQLSAGDGARVAADCGALSADHLEYVTDDVTGSMARTGVTGVLLPGSTFYLRQDVWAPARKLIDKGVAVALATDFNPGSSPIVNPAFIMNLACLKLGMTPHEALGAFTRNAAHCLRLDDYGWLGPGSRAAFTAWEVEDAREIAYYAGGNLVRETVIEGQQQVVRGSDR